MCALSWRDNCTLPTHNQLPYIADRRSLQRLALENDVQPGITPQAAGRPLPLQLAVQEQRTGHFSLLADRWRGTPIRCCMPGWGAHSMAVNLFISRSCRRQRKSSSAPLNRRQRSGSPRILTNFASSQRSYRFPTKSLHQRLWRASQWIRWTQRHNVSDPVLSIGRSFPAIYGTCPTRLRTSM
jgi:hypothetical protein